MNKRLRFRRQYRNDYFTDGQFVGHSAVNDPVRRKGTSPEDPSGVNNYFQKAKDFLAIAGGLAGIFIALLFIAGRSFIHGMVNAMNIPMEIINLSTWEYAEAVWRHLLFYIIVIVLACCLIAAIFILVREFVRLIRSAIFAKLAQTSRKVFNQARGEKWALLERNLLGASRIMFLMLIIAYVAYGVLYIVFKMQDEGAKFGRGIVEGNNIQVELVSDIPLGLNNLDLIRSGSNNRPTPIYVYTGYRFLFYNAEHYFISDDIDARSCKPSHLYTISTEHLLQVNFLPISPPKCTSPTLSPP